MRKHLPTALHMHMLYSNTVSQGAEGHYTYELILHALAPVQGLIDQGVTQAGQIVQRRIQGLQFPPITQTLWRCGFAYQLGGLFQLGEQQPLSSLKSDKLKLL